MKRKRIQCVEMDLFRDQPGQVEEKKEAEAVAEATVKAVTAAGSVKRAARTGQLSLFEDYSK